jgi:hypothetical protein
MPLVSVISGAYTGTFDSSNIGCSEDGFVLNVVSEKDPVRGDCYGDSVIDTIYRGLNVTVSVRSIAAATAQLMVNNRGTDIGAIGVVGTLGSAEAAALALSAVSGTPASAANDLGTFTAAAADLVEGNQSTINMANRVRVVPLTWRCLPTTITGVDRCFSFT